MGRASIVAETNFHELPRRRLQQLSKKHGIPANKTNAAMADALTDIYKNGNLPPPSPYTTPAARRRVRNPEPGVPECDESELDPDPSDSQLGSHLASPSDSVRKISSYSSRVLREKETPCSKLNLGDIETVLEEEENTASSRLSVNATVKNDDANVHEVPTENEVPAQPDTGDLQSTNLRAKELVFTLATSSTIECTCALKEDENPSKDVQVLDETTTSSKATAMEELKAVVSEITTFSESPAVDSADADAAGVVNEPRQEALDLCRSSLGEEFEEDAYSKNMEVEQPKHISSVEQEQMKCDIVDASDPLPGETQDLEESLIALDSDCAGHTLLRCTNGSSAELMDTEATELLSSSPLASLECEEVLDSQDIGLDIGPPRENDEADMVDSAVDLETSGEIDAMVDLKEDMSQSDHQCNQLPESEGTCPVNTFGDKSAEVDCDAISTGSDLGVNVSEAPNSSESVNASEEVRGSSEASGVKSQDKDTQAEIQAQEPCSVESSSMEQSLDNAINGISQEMDSEDNIPDSVISTPTRPREPDFMGLVQEDTQEGEGASQRKTDYKKSPFVKSPSLRFLQRSVKQKLQRAEVIAKKRSELPSNSEATREFGTPLCTNGSSVEPEFANTSDGPVSAGIAMALTTSPVPAVLVYNELSEKNDADQGATVTESNASSVATVSTEPARVLNGKQKSGKHSLTPVITRKQLVQSIESSAKRRPEVKERQFSLMSTDEGHLCIEGKENMDGMTPKKKRHQEAYKTPLTVKAKEKSRLVAKQLGESRRRDILSEKRGMGVTEVTASTDDIAQ